MKKFRLARNLLILCGFVLLLSAFLQLRVFQLSANKYSLVATILCGISCIFWFINAYIYNKKIIRE